jgi:glycosyltransferase involved in cell wall biosynthesis
VQPERLRRKLADAVTTITVSDFNLEYLQTTYRDDANRAQRVFNGLDLQRLTFSPPAGRRPLILGVGRLVAKKAFRDLVEACAVLAESGERFRCEIVGEGPLEDELKALISRKGIDDRVELLGALPHEAVVDRLRQASVLAAPCVVAGDGDRDGLPTILLEAMALGTPCVATDVTGIPEVLRDEHTGLTVPQAAPRALAEACARLIRDPRLCERLATNARARIETDFDIRRNTARMREIISRAAGHPGRWSGSQEVAS